MGKDGETAVGGQGGGQGGQGMNAVLLELTKNPISLALLFLIFAIQGGDVIGISKPSRQLDAIEAGIVSLQNDVRELQLASRTSDARISQAEAQIQILHNKIQLHESRLDSLDYKIQYP